MLCPDIPELWDSQIVSVETCRWITFTYIHGVTCLCRNVRISEHIRGQTTLKTLSGCFAQSSRRRHDLPARDKVLQHFCFAHVCSFTFRVDYMTRNLNELLYNNTTTWSLISYLWNLFINPGKVNVKLPLINARIIRLLRVVISTRLYVQHIEPNKPHMRI